MTAVPVGVIYMTCWVLHWVKPLLTCVLQVCPGAVELQSRLHHMCLHMTVFCSWCAASYQWVQQVDVHAGVSTWTSPRFIGLLEASSQLGSYPVGKPL